MISQTKLLASYIGETLAAAALLGVVKFRNDVVRAMRKHASPLIGLTVLNEVINVVASILFRFAMLLAPLALVWTTNGFQPFFVFVIGIVLTVFTPKFGAESIVRAHLLQRSIAISIMVIGTYLLQP